MANTCVYPVSHIPPEAREANDELWKMPMVAGQSRGRNVVTWPRGSQSAGRGQLGASSSFPSALTLKTEEAIQLCRASGW